MTHAGPFQYNATLVRVVDGDTIDVELDLGFHIKMHERVRIANVDAPEIWGKRATPEGRLCRDFVNLWFRRKKNPIFWVVSEKYDARGKYGRVIGRIEADGQDLGEAVKRWMEENGIER